MKLNDLKISTQLKTGFGIIVLLIALLGYISWNQSAKLMLQTADMYNHPLVVRKALGDLKAEILLMHRGMKDLGLAENDKKIVSILQDLELHKSTAFSQFEILYAEYLGPRSDVDSAYKCFVEWNIIREETINLLRSGYYKEAVARTGSSGPGGRQVDILLAHLKIIDDFALSKAEQFYLSAVELNNDLNRQLEILVTGIIIISLVIIILITRNIQQPLTELAHVTERFKNGNFDTRSDYKLKNEFGLLSDSFNELAETIETELSLNAQAAKLSEIMLEENDAHRFSHELLKGLLETTGAQMGAVYLLNESKTEFEHFECIGMEAEGCKSFSAKNFEGEFGKALATGKIQHIAAIPSGTRFSFATVSGRFTPREIVTIPVVLGNETVAVISLSAIMSFSKSSLRLLNTIFSILTARIDGVLAYRQVLASAELLEHQNQELDQKSKELVMQADELKEYNIELELQKKQLDELNKLKSAFLSNMSHELRTPLNSVIALSGVLSRRLDSKIPEDEYNYLGIIERNGKNLLSLINDILDLSRIESGKEEVTFSSFSIPETVSNILNSLQPLYMEKGISAVSEIPADLPDIICDQTKCHHILQNILSNAIKFTEKGSVVVSASVDVNNFIVKVSDTGIGISEDFMPFIFDEFRQADDNASRKYAGTGLGLAIVKKYCNLLNGSVEVTSAHGKGSTFTIILPVKPSDIQISTNGMVSSNVTSDSHKIVTIGEKAGAGKTLLIVEDSEAQIIQLKDILGSEGFNLIVARNGKEALDAIKLKIPDGMVLDLQMPEVDGFEVLRQIREMKETRSIPVLILTAKHITKAELSFLKENHIYQLIQKGALNRHDLISYIKNLIISEDRVIPEDKKLKKASVKQIEKASILVIEDNNDNLITLKALLEPKYNIITATNGAEGLEKAVQDKPQMVLMDISLPVMDGFKVLDEIRKKDELKGIQVIALTARAMKGDREDLLAYGFDGYIAKPVDSETFEKTIRDYLNFGPPTPLKGG